MMNIFSPYAMFFIPIIVGILAQIVKIAVFTIRHGWQPHYALTHGHMPSSHTAFVVSLVTVVGYYEGVTGGIFAVAVAFAVIVIDDAARLRVYMGDQGRYLNMLIRQLHVNTDQFPRLKERIGHRISEVIIGGIFGFVCSVLLIFFLQ